MKTLMDSELKETRGGTKEYEDIVKLLRESLDKLKDAKDTDLAPFLGPS